jgi:hypothetical protein
MRPVVALTILGLADAVHEIQELPKLRSWLPSRYPNPSSSIGACRHPSVAAAASTEHVGSFRLCDPDGVLLSQADALVAVEQILTSPDGADQPHYQRTVPASCFGAHGSNQAGNDQIPVQIAVALVRKVRRVRVCCVGGRIVLTHL